MVLSSERNLIKSKNLLFNQESLQPQRVSAIFIVHIVKLHYREVKSNSFFLRKAHNLRTRHFSRFWRKPLPSALWHQYLLMYMVDLQMLCSPSDFGCMGAVYGPVWDRTMHLQAGDLDPTCTCLVFFSRLLPELFLISFEDDHKQAAGTPQTVSGEARKKSTSHLCFPQVKSSCLLIELIIPLAISITTFEALTL